LSFLTIVSFPEAGCQRNISPQAQRAIDLFNNQQYNPALLEFQNLLERFPKDPLYQYYIGASLVETNSSYAKATEYLKVAVTKHVNNKALYYLGKSYYRQFRFDNALEAFNELKAQAKWQENKQFETSKEIARIDLARTFFSSAIQFSVVSKTIVRQDSVLEYLKKHAKLKVFHIGHLGKFEEDIAFLSDSDISIGKYYYFSAHSSLNFSGKDIFRTQKKADGSWSEPEKLGSAINTSDDEDFPFFNHATHTLYFSSKGHNSVGEYDIYKSTYSAKKNEWTEPEQFKFPFNSPWNDNLYFEDASYIYFASDRENNLGYETIYQVQKPVQSGPVALQTPEDKQECNLIKKIIFKTTPKKNNSSDILPPLENQQVQQPTSYLETISKALQLQYQSDSILKMVKKKKSLLNITTDKEKRANIFSENALLEKMAANYQSSANELYNQINTAQSNLTPNRMKAKTVNRPENENKFSFAGTTPYSKENPIPEEIQIPGGIVFRIQLGVFSKPLDFEHFGGLQPISMEKLPDNKIIKYYVGIFKRFNDADISLRKVKEIGYKEAFVIAYYDGKKIPLERAKELESVEY
jgi:hypothetical protein